MNAERDAGRERGRSPQCRQTPRRYAGLPNASIHCAAEQRELDPTRHPCGDRQPRGPPRRRKLECRAQRECEQVAEHDGERDANERESKRRFRIAKSVQRRRVQSAKCRRKQPDRRARKDAPHPDGDVPVELAVLIDHAGDDVADREERHRRRHDPEGNALRAGIEPLSHGGRDRVLIATKAGHRGQLGRRDRHTEQAHRQAPTGSGRTSTPRRNPR